MVNSALWRLLMFISGTKPKGLENKAARIAVRRRESVVSSHCGLSFPQPLQTLIGANFCNPF